MERIESLQDEFERKATFKLKDGRYVRLDARMVAEYGIERLMRQMGLEDQIPTGRVDVMRRGKKIGTVPATFDPLAIKSQSPWYDVRSGDFRREGDVWIASNTLGPGDLEAVPGFVWESTISVKAGD